jgi:hypothetical protein
MSGSVCVVGLVLTLSLITWVYLQSRVIDFLSETVLEHAMQIVVLTDLTNLASKQDPRIDTLIETVNHQGDGLRDHLEVHEQEMVLIARRLEAIERRVA